MQINRSKLLAVLESCAPGVSSKEGTEQSNCYVFNEGKVFTFKGTVACVAETGLEPTLSGAVRANELLEMLRKLPDDELSNEDTGTTLSFKGHRREVEINKQAQISMPVDRLETPTEWSTLPEGFLKACETARQCTGSDESQWKLTCVHFHPEWLEACDNTQMVRCAYKTGLTEPVLVRNEDLKGLSTLQPTQIGLTKVWVCFRNANGLILCCRRYNSDYRDLTPHFEVADAGPLKLPDGLSQAASRAETFAPGDGGVKKILVDLKPGTLSIKSENSYGRYREEFPAVDYAGSPLLFRVSTGILARIAENHESVLVSASRLKVATEQYTFVACLGKVQSKVKE